MNTTRHNYQKRLRQLTRLMDAADSGIDCSEKIRAISKSIARLADKHYPINYKRGGFNPNHKKHYTIDRDTWLARHGQPLSPTRSERALEERAHTSWLKFVRGPFKKTGDWTSTTVDTGKSFIFVMIKR